MIMPLGMTILTRAAGPHRVGRVMAVIGVPMLLGPIFGPILGGWLRRRLLLALDLLHQRADRDRRADDGLADPAERRAEPAHQLDWLGLALLSPGLALLIYGLAESGSAGGFGAPQVLLPGSPACSSWRSSSATRCAIRRPADRPAAVQNRVLRGSSMTLSLVVISVFGGMLLLPLYLQVVRGESAMDTGLLLAPQGFGAMLAMPIAGRLTDRTGVGRIVPVGLVLVALSFLALTQLAGDTSYWPSARCCSSWASAWARR